MESIPNRKSKILSSPEFKSIDSQEPLSTLYSTLWRLIGVGNNRPERVSFCDTESLQHGLAQRSTCTQDSQNAIVRWNNRTWREKYQFSKKMYLKRYNF
ncbi:MAG: hypothetical protein EAZ45_11775 [Oscillatoriales cyanobacterium]|nr:MAG: hypothetical protein EAZ45_11775 [Oscillatoriales cyanobacterium]